MPIEIERKFKVKSNEFINEAFDSKKIKQGYISKSKKANVRIRVSDDKGYITIKGKSDDKGISRYEWEHEISKKEALELLKFSNGDIVEKTRYLVKEESGLVFEIDVFEGNNKGLIIAEIELEYETQEFIKPNWLDIEVTGNKKYYNSHLSKNPYNQW